jgi:hypothetical protein
MSLVWWQGTSSLCIHPGGQVLKISIKAADAVWLRLEGQLETISPQQFLTVGEDDLRQCGLSRQKISLYL